MNVKGEELLSRRRPWLDAGCVSRLPEVFAGTVVDLADVSGVFLARGYVEPDSLYPLRILTYEREPVDAGFFAGRLRVAAEARNRCIDPSDTTVYRVFHEEGDGISGLTVDLYGDYVLIQYFSRGIQAFEEALVGAVRAAVQPRGIYCLSRMTRSRIYPSEPRGAHPTRLVFGSPAPEKFAVSENGLRFLVGLTNGAKTGLYPDMRDNREAVRRQCAGADVLNTFSYTASFSVYALAGGAAKTVNVDLSRAANELARENYSLNGFAADGHQFITDDVFDVMRRFIRKGRKFGTVIVDPPTFARGLKAVFRAEKDYAALCADAMRLLCPGGVLACALNSEELGGRWFAGALNEAARAAKRNVRTVFSGGQGPDFPVSGSFPEGAHLKFAMLRVA
ncbi:MAG TPA: class I SAM-dependent rRNA methyltransferase [bacterium]|nr:class I SAM-dependent rRNA methyltransferase [bacterium]